MKNCVPCIGVGEASALDKDHEPDLDIAWGHKAGGDWIRSTWELSILQRPCRGYYLAENQVADWSISGS